MLPDRIMARSAVDSGKVAKAAVALPMGFGGHGMSGALVHRTDPDVTFLSPASCHMNPTSRLQMINWLAGGGLSGLAENDLVRGFCERCCAEGIGLSRGLVAIDTLDPVFEGHGFRWSDTETNESDAFEYGPSNDSDSAEGWRRSAFYHMLENNQPELHLDLSEPSSFRFSRIEDLATRGHRHF